MVDKATRASHTTMPFSSNRDYVDDTAVPIESYGPCQGITNHHKKCGEYGHLGDGLCQKCWDKKWSIRISSIKRSREKQRAG